MSDHDDIHDEPDEPGIIGPRQKWWPRHYRAVGRSMMARNWSETLRNVAIAIGAIVAACSAFIGVACLFVAFNGSSDPIADPNADGDLPAGPVQITEDNYQQYCGWQGPDAAIQAFEAAGVRERFPDFRLDVKPDPVRQAGADAKKKDDLKAVKLWQYARAINGGRHFPCYRQEVGDCVANGAANAVNYLQAVQIVLQSNAHKYRPAYRPYIYGTSRVQIGGGRLGRSDGSLGIWAADAVRKYGILPADGEGVPPYSGSIARTWGYQGPPEWALDLGRERLVKSTAMCRGAQDMAEALSNGYPVTIASMQGFRMRGVVRDGKLWGQPAGQWAHQMCFIAYDPADKSFYLLNSWGPDAHGEPADDAPPGGFWVDWRTADRMASSRGSEAIAYSNFDGFPEQELSPDDLRIFSEQVARERERVGETQYALGL